MDIMCNLELDNSKVYAGEEITGKISYFVRTPQIINGIRVKILGKASWEKEEINFSLGRSSIIGRRRTNHSNMHDMQRNLHHRRRHERHYRDIRCIHEEDSFLEMDFYIFGNGIEENQMQAGTHIFRINYTLPSELPSSFKCEKFVKCSVKYTISSQRIIQSVPYEDAKENFFVFKNVNLNLIPQALLPAHFEMQKDSFFPFCCTTPLNFVANLSKQGVIAGRKIQIDINCDNKSCYSVKNIRIQLRLCLRVYSKTDENHVRYSRYVTMARTYLGKVLSREVKQLNCSLQIPPIHPWNEYKCKLFNITYLINFKIKFGFPHLPLKGDIPVVLGNMPTLEVPAETQYESEGQPLLALSDIDDADEIRFKHIQFQVNNHQPIVAIS